jgi:hypothetical protein
MTTKPELIPQAKRCDACGEPPDGFYYHNDGHQILGEMCRECWLMALAVEGQTDRLRKISAYLRQCSLL